MNLELRLNLKTKQIRSKLIQFKITLNSFFCSNDELDLD